MEGLHPYVAFLILPLFAFSAAGFSIRGLGLSDLFGPIALGVARGPLPRQAARRLRRRGPGHRPEARAAAHGRQVGRALRPVAALRHRLHHEPVHRPARLPLSDAAAAGRRCGSAWWRARSLSTLAGMAVLAWSQARRGARGGLGQRRLQRRGRFPRGLDHGRRDVGHDVEVVRQAGIFHVPAPRRRRPSAARHSRAPSSFRQSWPAVTTRAGAAPARSSASPGAIRWTADGPPPPPASRTSASPRS